MSADQESVTGALRAAAAITDKKGLDVVLLDVSSLVVLTDIFVIATGTSRRHVKTLVDEVEETLRGVRRRPLRREGVEYGRWVLLDYGDFVIHLFDQETRDYYELERLWADAPPVEDEPAIAEA